MNIPATIFEAVMILCWGVSWPAAIRKTWKTRSVEGVSAIFLWLVFIGYVSGILFKVFEARTEGFINPVIILYLFNFFMVAAELILFCGGWSLAALSGFYWIIEVRNRRRWAYIPVAFGMNSILIYTASVIAGLGEEKLLRGFLSAGHHSRQVFLSAVWINLLFLVLMLVAIVLYRKKVFFRM